MKKNTQFRVTLFEGADSLAEKIVSLAAKSNGRKENKFTLEQLKGVVESEVILYPALYKDTSAEIIGGRILHLDTKRGDEYNTVCVIEEVEVLELEPVNDENGYGAMAE